MDIRPATADDAQTIIEVIRDAGTMFRGVGMAAVSDNPPPSPEEIRAHIQDGHVWVASRTARELHPVLRMALPSGELVARLVNS